MSSYSTDSAFLENAVLNVHIIKIILLIPFRGLDCEEIGQTLVQMQDQKEINNQIH